MLSALRVPLFVSGSGARVTTWAPQEVDFFLGRGTPRTRAVQHRPRLRGLRQVPSCRRAFFDGHYGPCFPLGVSFEIEERYAGFAAAALACGWRRLRPSFLVATLGYQVDYILDAFEYQFILGLSLTGLVDVSRTATSILERWHWGHHYITGSLDGSPSEVTGGKSSAT